MTVETEYIKQAVAQQAAWVSQQAPPTIEIPPDAFYTTWDHINQVAGISCALGMIAGAITLYVAQRVRIYINGELIKREPHTQRSNHPQTRRYADIEDPDDEEQAVSV